MDGKEKPPGHYITFTLHELTVREEKKGQDGTLPNTKGRAIHKLTGVSDCNNVGVKKVSRKDRTKDGEREEYTRQDVTQDQVENMSHYKTQNNRRK